MDVLEGIQARRSIRAFKDTPVSERDIAALLKAATSAPTAANAQPWEFVVIDAPEMLGQLRSKLLFARSRAPLAIVVCGNQKLAFKGPGREMWVQDCSAATQNMLLAATALGLGSLWIGVYPLAEVVTQVQHLLDMPEYVVPLNIVYFGHPDEDKPPRTRFNEKRVYHNRYDKTRKHRKKDKPKTGHY
ncbi:nitroreductase family protein [Fusibacter sp. JL298sf-3]